MSKLGRWTAAAVVVIAALAMASPCAGAQLPEKIKRSAKTKVEARKKKTEAHIVDKASAPAETLANRAASPVDTVVSRGATAADRAVRRAMGKVTGGPREDSATTALVADLRAGRAVVPEIAFAPGADQPLESADPYLVRLSKAMRRVPGAFLVQAHVPEGAKSAAARALAQRRAAAVKTWLVAAGVPARRMRTAGVAAKEQPGSDRIEVVRMQ